MKCSWTLGIALVLSSVLFIPQTVRAEELYKREGGQAFHVRRDCPALSDYSVQKITDAEGLVPCRVCDAQDAGRLQAETEAAAARKKTNGQRPKTLQEMSGSAYEKPERDKPAPKTKVKYPPNWENSDNKYHSDGRNGSFYVENGQKVYVDDRQNAAGSRMRGNSRRRR